MDGPAVRSEVPAVDGSTRDGGEKSVTQGGFAAAVHEAGCACARVCARVRACARARLCVCVCSWACVCARARACVCASVFSRGHGLPHEWVDEYANQRTFFFCRLKKEERTFFWLRCPQASPQAPPQARPPPSPSRSLSSTSRELMCEERIDAAPPTCICTTH